MLQGRFIHLPPLVKLLFLFTAILFFGTLGNLLMSVIASPLFGVDINSTSAIQSNITFLQVYQIVQSISLFIIPSMLAFVLFYQSFQSGATGERRLGRSAIILTLALIFIAQVFIAYSGWLNHHLELPNNLQPIYNWMADKEQEAAHLTTIMIQTDTWLQIAVTIVMMSILPAIGEEWLFRGILQRELSTLFRNKHVAIIVTACLFSAIHMQFLSFLPRFFLGIILGYLFVVSGNLWLPVIAHFANNFMAIIAFQSLSEKSVIPATDSFESSELIAVVFSLLSTLALLYLIKRSCINSSQINND